MSYSWLVAWLILGIQAAVGIVMTRVVAKKCSSQDREAAMLLSTQWANSMLR